MQDIARPNCGQSTLLPRAVRDYLRHTTQGVTIRQLAREQGHHASTVQRRIRKIEAMRDDALIDSALAELAIPAPRIDASRNKEHADMNAPLRQDRNDAPAQEHYEREARRILRRLSEPGAVLAFAADMEKAVVVRETPDGRTVRTAVTDRESAQSMAIRDWLVCTQPGRVARYRITGAGRAALKRMLADDAHFAGAEPGHTGFAEQHRDWDSKDIPLEGSTRRRAVRYNAAESPIASMARRKDKDGAPFLQPEMVDAAERLREDFELSQMGPRVSQNWEKFLTGGDRGAFPANAETGTGSEAARNRVMLAVRELGPGLGDVALRVCCFLEGVEAAEKRLGWSARSGKIVLRIALQRLAQHYQRQKGSDLIG